jgi:hypothetical protein
MELDRVLELFSALHRHGVEYVLVGGVAINLHGLVRGTDDIDLFVRPTESNVGRLRLALREVWDDPEIERISAADLAGEYPTVRYGPPDQEAVVDLIARLGDSVRYEDVECETREWQGVPIRIATPRMLYRMKRDTLREDDRRDAQRLLERFGPELG